MLKAHSVHKIFDFVINANIGVKSEFLNRYSWVILSQTESWGVATPFNGKSGPIPPGIWNSATLNVPSPTGTRTSKKVPSGSSPRTVETLSVSPTCERTKLYSEARNRKFLSLLGTKAILAPIVHIESQDTVGFTRWYTILHSCCTPDLLRQVRYSLG